MFKRIVLITSCFFACVSSLGQGGTPPPLVDPDVWCFDPSSAPSSLVIPFPSSYSVTDEAGASNSLTPTLESPEIQSSIEYSVGSIPCSEGISPTGGRTYSIPIGTRPGSKMPPELSIFYNSQFGAGLAGFGWTISGLPTITIIPKNYYYHGKKEAPIINGPDAAYALDGVPIEFDPDPNAPQEYPYSTVRGNIRVKMALSSEGTVSRFFVLYPDGTKATFGFENSSETFYSYPLTDKEDIQGHKIHIDYYCPEPSIDEDLPQYNYYYNVFYPTSITYDYDNNDVAHGSISFTYSRQIGYSKYVMGRQVEMHSTVSSICSYDDSDILYKYDLEHQDIHGATLLTMVKLSNGTESLRPLKFSYKAEPTTKGLQYSGLSIMLNPSKQKHWKDYQLIRGKFIPGSYSDGVIALPKKDTYSKIETVFLRRSKLYFRYGSKYTDQDSIIVSPCINTGSNTPSLTMIIRAGNGFQTIQTLDVDNDGADEIVKVNVVGLDGNYTKLRITTYKFNNTGTRLDSSFFDVMIYGVFSEWKENPKTGTLELLDNSVSPPNLITVSSDYLLSPRKRTYFFGKFNDTGHAQLICVSHTDYMNTGDHVPAISVVDLVTHMVNDNERNLFNMTSYYERNYLVYDADGDGKTDIMSVGTDHFSQYTCDNQGNVSFVKTIEGFGSRDFDFNDDPYPFLLSDMNGDGYVDCLLPPSLKYSNTSPGYHYGSDWWHVMYYTGERFEKKLWLDHFTRAVTDELCVMDLNNDGLSDLIKVSGTQIDAVFSTGNLLSREIIHSNPYPSGYETAFVPANTLSLGRESHFLALVRLDSVAIAIPFSFSENRANNRCITLFEDSFGNKSQNTYMTANNRIIYEEDPERTYSIANGYYKQVVPIPVLDKVKRFDVNGTQLSDSGFKYFDSCFNSQGLGFSGFGKIEMCDTVSMNRTIQIYDPERLNVLKQIKYCKINEELPYHSVSNTYDNHLTHSGKMDPRMVKRVEQKPLSSVCTVTNASYDNYGFPTCVVTNSHIGPSENTICVDPYVPPVSETIIRRYEHSISPSKYLLGVVKDELSIKEGDGDVSSSWYEGTVYTYDDYYRPIQSKDYVCKVVTQQMAVNPNGHTDESLDLVSGYGYYSEICNPTHEGNGAPTPKDPPSDDYATPDSCLTALPCFDSLLVSVTRWQYDNNGNVVSEMVAPYNSTEFVGKTYMFDSEGRYMIAETNSLGLTTSYSGYNKYGKPTVVSDYLNRVTTFSYDAWGNLIETASPDGSIEQSIAAWDENGGYSITTTATGKPETVIFYDSLEREIKKGIMRFDGVMQFVDMEYNQNGRLIKTSLPYRTETPEWRIVGYDEYDRPVTTSVGTRLLATWNYDRNTVTTTRNGITSTCILDAGGRVISVTDGGGTICYSYRDDGQIASICAPGNVITSYTYDDFGRKTSMSDPSAGTQTFSYVWNPDGSSIITQINPHGTIITRRDKHGRTTLIERPGEYNTIYDYDSYGRVSSESSTNGTGKEYVYDALDRLSSIHEIVPDGKWLDRTFGYGPGSVLTSTEFASQSGLITTELYSYSFGNKVGTTLSDGTIVDTLLAENEQGFASRVRTGAVIREYDYNRLGFPTNRRMGIIQNALYDFDPLTGNLTSREDLLKCLTETFTYDALNRLTCFGGRHISYMDNGNISSIDGVGDLHYGIPSKPYQVTSLDVDNLNAVNDRQQSIAYTCYSRPSILLDGDRSAAFTYNGDGNRVKMYVAEGTDLILARYYIGDRYEYDQMQNGSKERLYLGGNAYSAPMVLQRENGGNWTAYNIGRDYLGNITHIATVNGTLIAEYSYDPWGRLRDPETLDLYTPGNEPELFLGRGYTGHEHLTWFGLINMNARLYDPLIGRFLSPDPFIQCAGFTQNLNRYSYGLNNPLKYIDESGESIMALVLTAVICGVANVIKQHDKIDDAKDFLAAFLGGAVVGAVGCATAGISTEATAFLGVLAEGVNSSADEYVKLHKKDGKDNIGEECVLAGIKAMVNAGIGKAFDTGFKNKKQKLDKQLESWKPAIKEDEAKYGLALKDVAQKKYVMDSWKKLCTNTSKIIVNNIFKMPTQDTKKSDSSVTNGLYIGVGVSNNSINIPLFTDYGDQLKTQYKTHTLDCLERNNTILIDSSNPTSSDLLLTTGHIL